MTTTQSHPPREAIRRAIEPASAGYSAANGHSSAHAAHVAHNAHGPHGSLAAFDPGAWQRMLQSVRNQHPSLNRVWFDEMVPRQLTNGVIQVTVATPAQLNFCQHQCQQPFTSAAQQITNRLVAVSFHCENLARGGVFNEGDQPLPLNPDYT